MLYSWQGQGFLPPQPEQFWGSTSNPICSEGSHPRVMTGTSSSVRVKNAWSYTSTPPYVFME
jgi:hypothetical protein